MAPAGGKPGADKGVAEVANDLWQLCRDYAKQETIDPLKAMGRFLGWGVGGALLLSLGVLFGAVAVLRGLQTQTGESLTGSLNFVPYLGALVFTIGAAGLAALAVKRPMRSEEKQG